MFSKWHIKTLANVGHSGIKALANVGHSGEPIP